MKNNHNHTKLKVAYLSKTPMTDIDLSFIPELNKVVDLYYFLEITPRYHQGATINLKSLSNRLGVYKAIELYPEFIKYKDILNLDRIYVVNTPGRFWLLKAFVTNFKLLQFIKQQNMDIVHAIWPYNIHEFVLYVLRKKTVLTVHDPFPHSDDNAKIEKARRWFAFKWLKNFIILNKSFMSDFIKFYHLENRNVYISKLGSYSYLNVVFKPKKKKNDYILFFGQISPYKGIEYLLKAFAQYSKENDTCRLIVAGGGNYYFDKSEYEKNPNIEFRNCFIPDDELAGLIYNSLFCVCPYTSATQSGVVMSAFAFNKPVIVSNVGALPEMLGGGKYGMIVPPMDAESLYTAIKEMVHDVNRRAEYEESIKKDYGTGFYSWKNIAKELYGIYRAIEC
jgi:glycosyltransferase involved in cell wall biosynthesis